VQSYGEKVLAAGAGLGVRSPKDIVNGDMKVYSAGGFQFAIAQAEVSDLYEMSDHIDALMKALTDLKDKRALDFSMLMITDIVSGSSRLLIANQPPVLDDLPYPQTGDGTRIAEGVVSRKKQLLPVVLGLLES
jgi:manganese-dependent inorganic pyrophosphatase